MILLMIILSSWPADWYEAYSLMNWEGMENVSSTDSRESGDLAALAISMFGNGTGDPVTLAETALALDSTDYRAWTALAYVVMEQDSVRMANLFSRAFQLAPEKHPILSETYAYWLLSTGNSTEAIVHSTASIEADSLFGPGWLTLSMALADEGRIDEALSVSNESMRVLSASIPLMHQYAQILAQSGAAEEAIEVYRQIIQRDSLRLLAYTDLADLFKSIKRNGEAIKVYRQVLLLNPEYARAWSNLASCFLAANRPDLADSLFQVSVELSPDDSEVLFQLAKLRINSNPESARELLESAVLLNPNYLLAWQELAFLYESVDYLAGAETALRKCVDLSQDSWLYGELGWVLETRGLLSEAAEVYETSVSIDPQYLYGWQRRGDLYLIDGESELAADWYTRALRAVDEDPWILGELGSIALGAALTDSAEHCFERALELDPEYSALWLDLARIQRMNGGLNASLSSLDQYLFLSGDSSLFSSERVLLLENRSENADSLEVEMLLRWPDAWIVAGWNAFDKNFHSLALDFANRAFYSSPGTPWYVINLGELFGALGKDEKQKECYDIAASVNTDDFQVAISIADYYYGEERYQEAIDFLSEAFDRFPWNEDLATSFAEACLFQDQLTRAEELLLEIVERNPSSVYAICYLGLIHENRGNQELALDRYLEALRLQPGYSYAESRLRYISSDSYDPGHIRRKSDLLHWSVWIDLSSTGGNIEEQYYGGGGNVSLNYGHQGSSVSLETSARSEIRDDRDIRKTAWASLSSEHFLTRHIYAGASSSWDRQPLTVRPWQVSSYLAAGLKSWPASWIWVTSETGAGLVNTKWSTEEGRTDDLTAFASLSAWATSSLSWLPSLWLSGSVYLPPKDTEKLVASGVGELEFDLPGSVSLVLGTSLDYTRTPVVESWEKLDSEIYIRLRF